MDSWAFFYTLYYNPLLLRQEIDYHTPAPPSEVIGDLFPVNQNSKIRTAGQLREEAGHCPDHIFFPSESGDLPDYTYAEKAPWRPKGSNAKGCPTQTPCR